ncbi:hypothetical protein C8J56DRAFT_895827 [Mycena floridula]|nr:hypothetical protein C8J56DRAFT_895827 [Mycena floridula]
MMPVVPLTVHTQAASPMYQFPNDSVATIIVEDFDPSLGLERFLSVTSSLAPCYAASPRSSAFYDDLDIFASAGPIGDLGPINHLAALRSPQATEFLEQLAMPRPLLSSSRSVSGMPFADPISAEIVEGSGKENKGGLARLKRKLSTLKIFNKKPTSGVFARPSLDSTLNEESDALPATPTSNVEVEVVGNTKEMMPLRPRKSSIFRRRLSLSKRSAPSKKVLPPPLPLPAAASADIPRERSTIRHSRSFSGFPVDFVRDETVVPNERLEWDEESRSLVPVYFAI